MHLVLKFHRLASYFNRKRCRFIAEVLYKMSRVIFSCDIKYTVEISDGVNFFHNAIGVVIHPKSKIGKNCSIYQNVTLGGNGKEKSKNGAPTLGENVIVGAGAVILGPVTIGDNVRVGANSVVICDIPSDCTVVGVPARIVRKNEY